MLAEQDLLNTLIISHFEIYLASLKKIIIGIFPFVAAESSAITVLINLVQMLVYQDLITDATEISYISFRIIDKDAYT